MIERNRSTVGIEMKAQYVAVRAGQLFFAVGEGSRPFLRSHTFPTATALARITDNCLGLSYQEADQDSGAF